MTSDGMPQANSRPSWHQEGSGPPEAVSVSPGSGWVAASKPGLIPLRPLILGDILGASFRLLRTSPKTTIGSSVLILSALMILSQGIILGTFIPLIARASSAVGTDRTILTTTAFTATGIVTLLTSFITAIGSSFLQGILTHVTARSALGERVTFKETWRLTLRHLWPLTLYTLLIAAIGLGGLLALAGLAIGIMALFSSEQSTAGALVVLLLILFVPAGLAGYYALTIKLLFTPSAIVLEQKSVREALRRSWQLTRGLFWRTLGISLLVQFIVSTVSSIAVNIVQVPFMILAAMLSPFGTASSGGIDVFAVTLTFSLLLMTIVEVAVMSFTMVLTSGSTTLLYVDARMRKEGLNLRMQQYRDETSAGRGAEDPFTAPPIMNASVPQPPTQPEPPTQPNGYPQQQPPQAHANGEAQPPTLPNGEAP